MNTRPAHPRAHVGFSLIELMVALVIGLILLGGLVTVMANSKKGYTMQNDLARIQENARFAMEFIRRDLRMAGYLGCMDDVDQVWNHVNGGTGSLFDTDRAIDGFEQGDSEWLPSQSTERVADINAGTDAISIRYLDTNTAAEVVPPYMPQAAGNIKLNTGNGLREGDIVAITDCSSTDIFQITGPSTTGPSDTGTVIHTTGNNVSPGNVNASTPLCPGSNSHCLSKIYEGGAQVMRVTSVRYYVGDTGRGTTALFRESLGVTGTTAGGQVQEIVEGIENMQILYGIDTDGDASPDEYQDATSMGTAAGLWRNVISVRVGLISSSTSEYGDNTDTDHRDYDADRDGVVDLSDPGDRRRRRVYTSTVMLRNS